MSLISFHSDILKHIFTFVSPGQRSVLRFVCPRFRQVITPEKVTCKEFIPYEELFEWAYAKHCRCDANAIEEVIRQGKLSIMKKHEWNFSYSPFDQLSASYGHLETLKWLLAENHITTFYPDLFRIAAKNGHLEVIRWMDETNISKSYPYVSSCRDSIGEPACQGGHLDILEWLVTLNYDVDQNPYYDAAATFGRTHVLKWFAARGDVLKDRGTSLCSRAAISKLCNICVNRDVLGIPILILTQLAIIIYIFCNGQ
jgi:F-box domain